MPEGTLVQTVSKETFTKYREALSGLNDVNAPEVMAKLINLGLTPGGGVVQRAPVQPIPMDTEQDESSSMHPREKKLKAVAQQMVQAL